MHNTGMIWMNLYSYMLYDQLLGSGEQVLISKSTINKDTLDSLRFSRQNVKFKVKVVLITSTL